MIPHSTRQLAFLLLVPLATIGAPAVPALAQQAELGHERPVLVWNDGQERVIRLEAQVAQRGFLGVTLLDLTPELRAHFGVPEDRGVMISSTLANSPAEKAGLLPADILTEIDGTPVSSATSLSLQIGSAGSGDTFDLGYSRSGRASSAVVTIDARERPELDISPLIERRIMIKTPHRLEIRGADSDEVDVDVDSEWVESVLKGVGEQFSEGAFLAQIETMGRERAELNEKLELMEQRLRELEAELKRLDPDSD